MAKSTPWEATQTPSHGNRNVSGPRDVFGFPIRDISGPAGVYGFRHLDETSTAMFNPITMEAPTTIPAINRKQSPFTEYHFVDPGLPGDAIHNRLLRCIRNIGRVYKLNIVPGNGQHTDAAASIQFFELSATSGLQDRINTNTFVVEGRYPFVV
ncbi:hypothetical protein PG995_006480 [Apiospora arundinis]